jgi:hypothetical protein
MDDADLDLATRAVLFAAVGTAGSAAPRRGGSSCRRGSRRSSRAAAQAYARSASAIRSTATLMGPLDRRRRRST